MCLQSWPNNVVWLQNQLAASKASWKLIVAHHPPLSSGEDARVVPLARLSASPAPTTSQQPAAPASLAGCPLGGWLLAGFPLGPINPDRRA